jgi:hypothetical protein
MREEPESLPLRGKKNAVDARRRRLNCNDRKVM